MDDEESLKITKIKQMTMLFNALAACNGDNAKGHGLFLYTHDDATHMTVLSFNAGSDDIYSMVQHANDLVAHAVAAAMQDAPPKEKWN
jgi:hypothetical protein